MSESIVNLMMGGGYKVSLWAGHWIVDWKVFNGQKSRLHSSALLPLVFLRLNLKSSWDKTFVRSKAFKFF